jgi:hypothetical protein
MDQDFSQTRIVPDGFVRACPGCEPDRLKARANRAGSEFDAPGGDQFLREIELFLHEGWPRRIRGFCAEMPRGPRPLARCRDRSIGGGVG